MQNIVVLGAGFGGLRAAMKLGRKSRWLARRGYQIILIDQNSYHTYTPTLYEVATTSKETATALDLKKVTTYPIAELVSGRGIQFRQETVASIDARRGQIILKNNEVITYSHLIFALGASPNFFQMENLEEKAFTLKSFTDAIRIRDSIVEKVLSAKYNREINIVICGAGSTGVELAAEMQEWFCELKEEGQKCNIKTTLLDSSPSILSKFDKDVIRKAEKRLKKFGVNVLTKSPVEKITGDKITLKGDVRIRYDILIWAGGIQAHPLTQSLPFKKSSRGVEVDKYLRSKLLNKRTRLSGDIYVVGDNAALKNSRTRLLVPQMARPAISQGTIAAQNIISTIAHRSKKAFVPIEYPYVVPVGGKYALVKLGPFLISGIFGWILKGLIELGYLISIMPLKRALKIWYGGLLMFIQNDRLG